MIFMKKILLQKSLISGFFVQLHECDGVQDRDEGR